MVCLIKPQFEAGREKVGKKGVVRDQAVHREVIEQVFSYAEKEGFILLHLTFSPVKGPEGNIEYLLHLKKKLEGAPDADIAGGARYDRQQIADIVREAHDTLDSQKDHT